MLKIVQAVKTITNNSPILFVVFLIAFWGINRFSPFINDDFF